MRKMVKRLLNKYKYPPDDIQEAINIVISQVRCGQATLISKMKVENYNDSI